jgi:predicted permease
MFFGMSFNRERDDFEQRQELESYLEIAADEFVSRGMSPVAARHAARVKLGNPTLVQEQIYTMNTSKLVDSVVRHVRYTGRTIRRNPLFAGIAVLTLALGIGANTAVFTVVNRVLLRPLPYPHADELVTIHQVAPGAPGLGTVAGGLGLSPSMYFTYSEQNHVFQALGVWTPATAAVTGFAEPEQVRATAVSDGTLEALGVQPVLGRALSAGDQALTSTATVMLTYGYWQRRFGGDRSVIGRTLVVDGRPNEIVGVLPEGFRIADTPADLILPIRFDRSHTILTGFYLRSIARLKPGVSIQQANADIARLVPVWMRSWTNPGFQAGMGEKVYTAWRITPALRPLRDEVVGNAGEVLWVVMGTLGIVMLIACANVANLLLVRAEGRQQELGVRAALGAGWGRIARDLLTESVLLACAGGVVGMGLAYASLAILKRIGPAGLPRLDEISLDARSLGFGVAVALLSGLLFGLIPALKYAGSRISPALRGGARGLTQSRERNRVRNTLVVGQVALALVLLIGSSLMIRTFQALRSVDPGFSGPEHLQTFRVTIPRTISGEPEKVVRTQNEILDKVRAVPGVTAAAFASNLPMDGSEPMWDSITPEGESEAEGERGPMRSFVYISPGYFRAAGTRLAAGRDLTWSDIYGQRPYVMVSANLAREVWGSPSNAIGKRIRGRPWLEVIGVVEDVRSNGVHDPAPATVYWSMMQAYFGGPQTAAFLVRSNRAGTAPFVDEIRKAVWSVNAGLPPADVQTMETMYEHSMASTSFTLVMLAIAGVMALALGVIGIYGVIAYTVAQRRREVGIRMALGAAPGVVTRMFVRYGLVLSALGTVAGIAAAAGLSRLMSSILFGVTPLDPMTYTAVPVVLVGAAMLASYLPARRATAVDPVRDLRAE